MNEELDAIIQALTVQTGSPYPIAKHVIADSVERLKNIRKDVIKAAKGAK